MANSTSEQLPIELGAIERSDDKPSKQREAQVMSGFESHGNEAQPRSTSFRSKLQLTATLLALFVCMRFIAFAPISNYYDNFLNICKIQQLSLFLAALDFTIATTATPTIVNELHSATAYTWIGSAYLLASAAATPVWAKLSDIWGRKIVFLAADATFFAGSAICASSTSMGRLIVGRSIQGSAAGGIIILTNICISDLFSMR
jgi:hypothetical protein